MAMIKDEIALEDYYTLLFLPRSKRLVRGVVTTLLDNNVVMTALQYRLFFQYL